MTITRRDFVKTTAVGTATVAAAAAVGGVPEAEALQRPNAPLPPEAVGLLYDSTLCIGCKACVNACKDANAMPKDPQNLTGSAESQWDTPLDLSASTLNIIKVYRDGTAETKDQEDNGFAFVKNQCMHCLDPSCVSSCPVQANRKDGDSGIVSHNPEACIGCRYCVLSCPFGVPKYQYNTAFGEIKKCQLCQHRLAEEELPGCADVCPTGATLFGPTDLLRAEATRRIAFQPGETQVYPRGDITGTIGGDRPSHEKVVHAAYQPKPYGLTELGGTQCLKLSAVSYGALGMPVNVPEYGYPALSEGIQHTLYKGLIAPAVMFAGLALLARRTAKHDGESDHDS